MLNLFREHARSWFIKVALFIIVIVFVFWGGYSYTSRQESQMARVDDRYISIVEYNQAYNQMLDMYKRQMGKAFSEDLLRQMNLKKQVLDSLIDRYLVTKAADQLGLAASIREIQEKVIEYPVFQEDGKFDQNRYVLVLRQNRMTPEAFEQRVSADLSSQKVEEFVKRRAIVTEDEIRADFSFNYGMVQLGYVLFDPQSFTNWVVVGGNSLETYYQDHLDRYKEPEKREFSLVLFKPGAYAETVAVTEDDARRYYEDNGSKYHHPEEVRALHILISVAEGSPEPQVEKARGEAEKVLLEVKSGKDFKELAKKYSQDPSAAQNGGDLGFFTHDRMTPAFSDAAFALQPGQVSGLVQTPYGFHIVKVVERHAEKTESFEEARAGIESSLKEEKSRDIAYKKARSFADFAYAAKDISKAAETEKLEVLGMGLRVAQTDSLPGMGTTTSETMKRLFALAEKDVSEVIEDPQGFLVTQVKAVQPAGTLPFEKVKDKVEKDFKANEARSLAQAAADGLLMEAKKSGSLKEAGKARKVEIKESEWFSRREPYKDLTLPRGESQNKVFQLEVTRPFPDRPLDLGNQFLVCQLLGRNEPMDKLEKERDGIKKRLQQQKETVVWQAWLDEQRRNAQVEIYREP